MNTTKLVLIASALSFSFVAAAFAAPSVENRLTVMKIETRAGAESKTPADRAAPGDVLEYASTFSNQTGEKLTNFSPSIPVPAGTEFIAGSAQPKPQFASLDGINFAAFPLTRDTRGANGVIVRQEVPAAEYRALRWTDATFAAGAQVAPSIRVRVIPVAAPAAATPAVATAAAAK